METTVRNFKGHLNKLNAYNHAMGVLSFDSVTAMPRGGSEHLGNTYAVLSQQIYELTVSPAFKDMILEILDHKDQVDYVTRREAEELYEQMQRTDKIPMEEYVAYQLEVNEASNVWHTAKETNDFALFAPHLQKLVDYSRRFAAYWDSTKPAYDVLLDTYEKGITMGELDQFFSMLRQELLPLVKEIAQRGQAIDDSPLHKRFPIEKQRKLSKRLMEVMTIDPNHCSIAETEHPFTDGFSREDVRITTHYYESEFASSMYSVIHEGGHALYELNIGDDIKYSPLGTGSSMGIHESQSRFFENIIGRSESFLSYILPDIQRLGPRALKAVSPRDFYRMVNKSQPSLIRTEADELTYCFHIMVRYELEKRLIAGELSVEDLPREWNRLYKEYLGVDVPNDTMGVLQDSHWSGGAFGYFPSYALGSAYGAQMLHTMEQDIPVWELVGRGELCPIVAWLRERIYRFGCLLTPKELLQNACQAPFDPQYYVRYLTSKYREVYGL
ncbi:MAG: carboxypeptidase M32 [Clostridia bacterium]|nr:carboxypeptidase M32 [Clostridia bacterium]